MNIFVLDLDPVKAARYACDKHVVKMPTETAQILSTIIHPVAQNVYRPVKNKNHPVILWAGKTRANFIWTVNHGIALCDEYYFRYGEKKNHHHVAKSIILECAMYVNHVPEGELTPFHLCMPDIYRSDDPVLSYHKFYLGDKARFARWTRREIPEWFNDGCLLSNMQK